MPQMSPMSWMFLFFMFTALFLFFNILNYFNFLPTFQNKNNLNIEKSNNNESLNWKW